MSDLPGVVKHFLNVIPVYREGRYYCWKFDRWLRSICKAVHKRSEAMHIEPKVFRFDNQHISPMCAVFYSRTIGQFGWFGFMTGKDWKSIGQQTNTLVNRNLRELVFLKMFKSRVQQLYFG